MRVKLNSWGARGWFSAIKCPKSATLTADCMLQGSSGTATSGTRRSGPYDPNGAGYQSSTVCLSTSPTIRNAFQKTPATRSPDEGDAYREGDA
jgi:hypothetical protein